MLILFTLLWLKERLCPPVGWHFRACWSINHLTQTDRHMFSICYLGCNSLCATQTSCVYRKRSKLCVFSSFFFLSVKQQGYADVMHLLAALSNLLLIGPWPSSDQKCGLSWYHLTKGHTQSRMLLYLDRQLDQNYCD